MMAAQGGPTADGPVRARPERRRLLRFGTLQRGQHQFRIRLRNISSGGALVECAAPLEHGSFVEVDFGAGGPIEAEVRWCRDEQVGLKFAFPLNLSSLAPKPKPGKIGMLSPTYLASEAYADASEPERPIGNRRAG